MRAALSFAALDRADLHRAWVQQLYREHRGVVFHYRLPIRSVLIRIEDLGRRWGTWSPGARTITISTALIEQHPWDVVIEVLKHEIAHQIVTDVFRRDEAHGPAFQEAARMVGLSGWAARAGGELPDEIPRWKDRALGDEEEKLLRRVEKLLALAGSSNEHEAIAAMGRVRDLYARYNLEQVRDRKTAEMVAHVIDTRRKRIEREESKIATLLIAHFFVEVVFGERFDAQDATSYRTIELLGTRENVLMADYVRTFLHERTTSLWEAFKERTNAAGRQRRSYVMGVLSGFGAKLERERSVDGAAADAGVAPAEARALMVVAGKQLSDFVAQRHPRLRTSRLGAAQRDPGTFRAGQSEGERLTLHRPVEGTRRDRGLMLPSGSQ